MARTVFKKHVEQFSEEDRFRVHVRWLIRRDLPSVLDIEKDSFPYPWDEREFLYQVRQRHVVMLVAEHVRTEKILGYMVYNLRQDSIDLINFAVHPGYRRRSIGAQMVAKLISKLSSKRRNHVTLCVSEKNDPAHHFFKSQGFRATGVFRNFFGDQREDAYQFEYRFSNDSE